MADKVKGSLGKLFDSVASQPLLSLLLIIFLTMTYVQVVKLDDINKTLISIHQDNIRLGDYIKQEQSDSERYADAEKELNQKIALILELLRKVN